MPRGILGRGSHVEHDQVAVVEAAGQLVAVDLLNIGAVTEVGGGERVERLGCAGR